MPTTILDVLPRPRVLTLAGRGYVVEQLQLRDLADLQAWLADEAADPMADLPSRDFDPEPATRRKRVLAAWQAMKTYPPAYGTDEAADRLSSPAGRAAFVYVVLAKRNAITAEEAVDVARGMSSAEWRSLRRAAYSSTAWKELAREIDPDFDPDPHPDAPKPKPYDWIEAFETLSANRGWTYDQIGNLYLSQWRAISSGGRSESYRSERREGESAKEHMARTKALFRVEEDS